MTAQSEYEALHRAAKEAIYGSAVGMGEFLAQTAVAEEPRFMELLLLFVNRRPLSAENLRDYLDDQIEQHCQREADAGQFGQRRVSKEWGRTNRMARMAVGMPEETK